MSIFIYDLPPVREARPPAARLAQRMLRVLLAAANKGAAGPHDLHQLFLHLLVHALGVASVLSKHLPRV